MTDHMIRALERSGRATGDRLAWLAARQRAGDLDPDGLELAAFMGDPAARELAPDVPAWDPTRDSRLLASWSGFPALHGTLDVLRWAITRADDASTPLHDLLAACTELAAAPSQEWVELIRTLEPAWREQAPAVELAARSTWQAAVHLRENLEFGGGALSDLLQELPEQDRVHAERLAREAIASRALASPHDPTGPWQAEARWLDELERDLELTRHEVKLLATCGYRPAAIQMGRALPPPLELEPWLAQLVGRKLPVRELGYPLRSDIDSRVPEGDPDHPCWHCQGTDAAIAGSPPEEVVAIRGHMHVKALEAGLIAPAEYELWRKLELQGEGAPVETTLDDLLAAAAAMGPWRARRRIAAWLVGDALRGPQDENFRRYARRQKRYRAQTGGRS